MVFIFFLINKKINLEYLDKNYQNQVHTRCIKKPLKSKNTNNNN